MAKPMCSATRETWSFPVIPAKPHASWTRMYNFFVSSSNGESPDEEFKAAIMFAAM